jgi:hypothetical protein
MVRSLLAGIFVVVSGLIGGAAPGGDEAASPTEVAMAFARAMDVGDAMAAKSLALSGEGQTRLVDAMSAMTRSQQRLLKVGRLRFGDSAKILVGPYADPGLAATVGRSKLTVEGDTALLREQPGMIFLKLRRVEGRWLVDVAGSSEAEVRKEEIPILEKCAGICDEAADRVAAGRYATAQETQLAMIALIKGDARATSGPTTRSAATNSAATKPAATKPSGRGESVLGPKR